MNTEPVDLAVSAADWASRALDQLMARCMAELLPRPELSIIDWAEKYRKLSSEENPDYAGDYRLDNTPALRGILAVCGDRRTRRAVVQKAAQQGYTAGVVCNVLGYYAHWKPCVQVVMFPREKSAKDFDSEKFSPMVRATAVLAERIRLKSRSDGNSATRKKYPGGLIKFVASNSPSDVKSTSAKIRIVEEPDDTNKDVRGQGNSMFLLRERGKTIREGLDLIGGTPTIKGASEVEKEMRTTDQRRFMVPCHHCGERHEVSWDQVHIPGAELDADELSAPDIDARWPSREVYGRARWEDAYYACPHCGGIWTDEERIANMQAVARVPPMYGWEPTATADDPGFFCNELQSTFHGSRVPVLAEKYMRAMHLYDRGDPTEMIAFCNSTRGRAWEYKGDLPEEDELRDRAEGYAEWSTPAGGLMVLLTVDVQHDRLAVTAWAVGRGEEMWLAYWGELPGRTIVSHQGAWCELELLMSRTVRHASGAELRITAVAIDTGDGQTSEAAYDFVRKHDKRQRPVRATKGASDNVGRVEIWTKPKPIDPNKQSTKASRSGVQSHQVGAAKAKDLILGWGHEAGRLRLPGNGAGRLHWYRGVRDDWFVQILGEMKVPSPKNYRVKVWVERTDRRNEALDCTVLAVWLCRELRLHLYRASQWDAIEERIRQASLLDEAAGEGIALPTAAHQAAEPALAPPASRPPAMPDGSVPAVPAAPAAQAPPSPRPIAPHVLGGGISLAGSARFGTGGRR